VKLVIFHIVFAAVTEYSKVNFENVIVAQLINIFVPFCKAQIILSYSQGSIRILSIPTCAEIESGTSIMIK
jgi:hypothetical protein